MARKKAAPSNEWKPFNNGPDDADRIKATIKAIEKEFAGNTIMTFKPGLDMTRFPYQISTGSIGLDIALGNHMRRPDGRWQTGIAPARIGEIFGPESSGKTTLLLYIIACCQALGGRAAFIDAEHALDPKYAQALGVKIDELYFCQPDSGADALNIAQRLIESGLYNLVVVDSVDALVPKEVLDGEIGEKTVGALARLMGDALRKFAMLKSKAVNCNLIFTNQMRDRIAKPGERVFGEMTTTPGGRALKFYADYRIDVRRGSSIVHGEKSNAVTIGHRIRCKVLKNKVAPPYKDAEIPLIYGSGFDVVEELIEKCVEFGVVTNVSGDHKYMGVKFGNNRVEAVTNVRRDPRWSYGLYDALFTRILAQQGYNADGTAIPGFDLSSGIQHQSLQFAPLTPEQIEEAKSQEINPDVPVPQTAV